MALQRVVKKFKLGEEPSEYDYWKDKTMEERIAHIEYLRTAGRTEPSPGIQKVVTIIKMKRTEQP